MKKTLNFLTVLCVSMLCLFGISETSKAQSRHLDYLYFSTNDDLKTFLSDKTFGERRGEVRFHFQYDGTYIEQYLKNDKLNAAGDFVKGKWHTQASGEELCMQQDVEGENVTAPSFCFEVRLLPEEYAHVSYHIHPFLLVHKNRPDRKHLALNRTMVGNFILTKEGVEGYQKDIQTLESLEHKMKTVTQGQNNLQPQNSVMERLYNYAMNKVIETEFFYLVSYPNGSVVASPKSVYNSGAEINKIRMATANGFWHLEGNAFCFKVSSATLKEEKVKCLGVHDASDLLEPQEGFLVHNVQGYSYLLNKQNAYTIKSMSYPAVFDPALYQ